MPVVFDSDWQVVVASRGEQSTKVEKWGLGKLVVKQVILASFLNLPILTGR